MRKAARDQRFELGADRLAEHRRGAVGGDADHQRRAVDDGAEGEVAELRLVDDVDRNAAARAAAAKAPRPRRCRRRRWRWRRRECRRRPGAAVDEDAPRGGSAASASSSSHGSAA
jgi:hypothetical protein